MEISGVEIYSAWYKGAWNQWYDIEECEKKMGEDKW